MVIFGMVNPIPWARALSICGQQVVLEESKEFTKKASHDRPSEHFLARKAKS
jgi:hypothetical protein